MIRRIVAGVALIALMHGAGQSAQLADRTKGRPGAPITIYEMSDFQCPYCRQFTLETLPQLEHDYVATGKVRMVYINFPLTSVHQHAALAAEVAMCGAQQHRFWPMHDLLFRHQGDWANLADEAATAYLLALGDSAGLDHARLAGCMASGTSAADVRADAERARRAGAKSTPTFYIEGGLLEGAAPFTVFREVLDSIYRSKTSPSPRPR